MEDNRQKQLSQFFSSRQGQSVQIPKQRAGLTKVTPQGQTVEIFDPARQLAEKSTEPAFGVMEGLSMTQKLFDEADRLIPATESPVDATLAGLGRSIGSTDVGRLVGMPDEKARAYKNFRMTFGTLLARAFGEKGVVTNQDVERVMSGFPKFGDTIENRQIQRKFMVDLLTQKIQRYNQLVSLIGSHSGRERQVDVYIPGPKDGNQA